MPDLTTLLSKFLTDLYTWASGSKGVGAFTGRLTAQTAAIASLASVTVGGADTSYEVSANILATVATTFSFDVLVAWTDESNVARSVKLNMMLLTHVLSNSAALANTNGPSFNGIPMHIRAKAGTTVTVSTAGTFTTVTYNAEATIKQIAQ